MESEIRLAQTASNVTKLGPGSRYVVWVQGCPLRCPGCLAPETWRADGGFSVAVDDLANLILDSDADGLTFSGGEPFQQAEAVLSVIRLVQERSDISLMSYTGYAIEDLIASGTPAQQDLLARLDLLIDGPYLAEEHDNLLWRASRNQRIHVLSERHRGDVRSLEDKGVGIQFQLLDDGMARWIGVPITPDFREQFEQRLRSAGINLERQRGDRT